MSKIIRDKNGNTIVLHGGDVVQGDKVGGNVYNIANLGGDLTIQNTTHNGLPAKNETREDEDFVVEDFVVGKTIKGDSFNATNIIVFPNTRED